MSGIDIDPLDLLDDGYILTATAATSKAGLKDFEANLFARSGSRRSIINTILSSSDIIDRGDVGMIGVLVDKLISLRSSLEAQDGLIHTAMKVSRLWTRVEYAEELQNCGQISDTISLVIKRTQAKMTILSGGQTSKSSSSPVRTKKSRCHLSSLPKIELPRFDSDPVNYGDFISQFTNMINNTDYSDWEKYLVLVQHINGEGKALVKMEGRKGMSYATALKALDKAYSDTGLQQNALIERIMKLSMDASCPFAWINEAASFRDQIQTFNVTSDDFLRYFLWRGLTDDFKEQLIAIVGSSRPSVDDILDNIHEAKSRIKETKKVPSTSKSVALATTVSKKDSDEPPKTNSPKPLSCVLCGGAHKIGSCTGFSNADYRVGRKMRF